MKFSEYPQEIKDKVYEECNLQNRKYSEEKLNERVTSCFNWDDSNQHHNFWEAVLKEQKFDVFFKKYPKSESKFYYTSSPTNVKVGDKFEIIGNKNWNGQEGAGMNDYYKIGDILTLFRDDGTQCPYFTTSSDKIVWVFWGQLKPVSSVKPTDKTLHDLKIGDYVKVKDEATCPKHSWVESIMDESFGKTYTIKNIGKSGDIHWFEFQQIDYKWAFKNLELATHTPESTTEEWKIGDIVECVKRTAYLSMGKQYTIKELMGSDCIKIIDNDGDRRTYRKSNFKLISLNKSLTHATSNKSSSNSSNLCTTSESDKSGIGSTGVELPGRRRPTTVSGGYTGNAQSNRRSRPSIECGKIRTSI